MCRKGGRAATVIAGFVTRSTDNCGWEAVKNWFSGKLGHYWITLGEDWITTGLDLGGTGLLPDYMSSDPTGATYLPDLYRLPYPVEVLD